MPIYPSDKTNNPNINKLNIGITTGDPSGIGPEVVAKSISCQIFKRLANLAVIGDGFVFKKLGLYKKIQANSTLIDLANIRKSEFCFGKTGARYGKASIEYIDSAISLIKQGKLDCLVTAPVNKQSINRAGIKFLGHTEYIAQKTETANFAMMFVTPRLKVVLVSRHLALNQVSKYLTRQKIYNTILLTIKSLREDFKINRPHIGVCALNPHAGEGGYLGHEEKDKIIPVIKRLRQEFTCTIEGPFASDTLFYLANRQKFDAIVAMYHDQGLIPVKLMAFNRAVNLTLGLPFIRTSACHGTALELAGRNRADPGSLLEAIKLAIRLYKNSRLI